MAAGGGGNERAISHTPTWAVASVCAVIVVISILLEKLIHHFGEWFQKRRKKALYEALGKIKTELMILGFISLLLTFGQNSIANICIPERAANTMLPCALDKQPESDAKGEGQHRRKLLRYDRRFLAGASTAECPTGSVPLISVHALHQLHIFIFFLAVFHVIYSAMTMALGRLKIRQWKEWERECMTDYEAMNDPSRVVLTHQNSFVREHNKVWAKTRFTFYFVCFLRQFVRSVRKGDYLIMRHAFISVHLSPGSRFNFQKYIKRSLEDDFKTIVEISPVLWASVCMFLLLDVGGWHTMLWLSIVPLLVILAVGTKLQAIITSMALDIKERNTVIQGIPNAQVTDKHFWFEWPQFLLYLIHYILFQNAFEITYSIWIWYEFGLSSCFHSTTTLTITRVVLGLGVQFLCSYITLPLYALLSQMGSNLKSSIFDEQTSKALLKWHKDVMRRRSVHKPGAITRTLTRTWSMMSGKSDNSEQSGNSSQRWRLGGAGAQSQSHKSGGAGVESQTHTHSHSHSHSRSLSHSHSRSLSLVSGEATGAKAKAKLSKDVVGDTQAAQTPELRQGKGQGQGLPGGQPDLLTGS